MNKNKSLVAIIIFLLISNIVLVVYFLLFDSSKKENGTSEKGRFSVALKEDVGFSKDQLEKYQELRKVQMEKMGLYFADVKKAKFSFYHLLNSMPAVSDSTLENAADIIGQKQKELDINIFRHFTRIKAICTPGQLPKFDTAMSELVERMINRKK